jgi:hypothetical protein
MDSLWNVQFLQRVTVKATTRISLSLSLNVLWKEQNSYSIPSYIFFSVQYERPDIMKYERNLSRHRPPSWSKISLVTYSLYLPHYVLRQMKQSCNILNWTAAATLRTEWQQPLSELNGSSHSRNWTAAETPGTERQHPLSELNGSSHSRNWTAAATPGTEWQQPLPELNGSNCSRNWRAAATPGTEGQQLLPELNVCSYSRSWTAATTPGTEWQQPLPKLKGSSYSRNWLSVTTSRINLLLLLCSGMRHPEIRLKLTKVLEEHNAAIFTVE